MLAWQAVTKHYAPAGCIEVMNLSHRDTVKAGDAIQMSDSSSEADTVQNRVIEQIVELQREFYFENKGKETERRRRLRDLIERATSAGDA